VGVGPSRALPSRYKKVSCQAALERPHNDAFAIPIAGRALDLGVNYIGTSSIDVRSGALERAITSATPGNIHTQSSGWRIG
jgi:hypothetical protein